MYPHVTTRQNNFLVVDGAGRLKCNKESEDFVSSIHDEKIILSRRDKFQMKKKCPPPHHEKIILSRGEIEKQLPPPHHEKIILSRRDKSQKKKKYPQPTTRKLFCLVVTNLKRKKIPPPHHEKIILSRGDIEKKFIPTPPQE